MNKSDISAAGLRTTSAPTIHRQVRPGLAMTIVEEGPIRQFHFTLRPRPGETVPGMLWRLDGHLRENEAAIARHEIFGPLASANEIRAAMKQTFGDVNWPVTYLEGKPWPGSPIAGMHVLAFSGTELETVRVSGRPIGRVFNDGQARHCVLGDVLPLGGPKALQVRQVFENLESALSQAGMSVTDIIRTWFFLDGILSWYGTFNLVRSEFFVERKIHSGKAPASTGIGARNSAGAALVAGAWAARPLGTSLKFGRSGAPTSERGESAMQWRSVVSPLQCAASSYGSCFSRAVELKTSQHRHLLVSGTASISPNGTSSHPGDFKAQVRRAMAVVEAILGSRDMDFSQVTRATIYLRNIEDAPLFGEWCAENKVCLPAVVAQCDICRNELLFEIELDAVAQRPHRAASHLEGLEKVRQGKISGISPLTFSLGALDQQETTKTGPQHNTTTG